MRRLLHHAFTAKLNVRRMLSREASQKIANAVREAERGHSGQIRVVIEGTPGIAYLLRGGTTRDRALEVFALERVWDTAHNNGVLLYLMVAGRDAEIVADRGLNGKVSEKQWNEICVELEKTVATSGFVAGVCSAIQAIGCRLREHYPGETTTNELSDDVIIRG